MQAFQAPAALQGQGPMHDEDPFDYVLDTVLTGNQLKNETIDIDADSDFMARGVYIASATGAFKVRFADSRQYFVSNLRVASQNLSTDPAAPYPLFPELPLPANGRILVELEDTSGAGNTIQLVFRGAKRWRR